MTSSSMIDRFGGIARLYGEVAFEQFLKSHVAIVGVGGVGCWSAESLARSGIGKITLIDIDDLCITNTNRQIHALDNNYGKQKTAVMAERIKAINPECEVVCVDTFYSSKNAEQLIREDIDFVIDAIDQVMSKAHLIQHCKKLNIPIVTCGGTGGLSDPSKIEIVDLVKIHNDSLLKKVRNELRTKYGFPKGTNSKKQKKLYVTAVFSSEPAVYPTSGGDVSPCRADAVNTQLNCTTGFGSITHITASFGFFATAHCLRALADQSK